MTSAPSFIHIAYIPEHQNHPRGLFRIEMGGRAMGPTLNHDDAQVVADWLSEAWPALEEIL